MLEGLKMTIENFDEMNLPSTVTVPDFPSDPQCNKTHEVAFSRVVYIERSDYRQVFEFLASFGLVRFQVGSIVLHVHLSRTVGGMLTPTMV